MGYGLPKMNVDFLSYRPLVELRGAARVNDVLDRVEIRMSYKLDRCDRQTLLSHATIPRR